MLSRISFSKALIPVSSTAVRLATRSATTLEELLANRSRAVSSSRAPPKFGADRERSFSGDRNRSFGGDRNRSFGGNDRARAGRGGGNFDRPASRGRGGGGGFSYANTRGDPFSNLRFAKTVKIDPEFQRPITDVELITLPTLQVLQKRGFELMTPVQSQSFEIVYNGEDVVARSRTGTGKTFAFGLPLIEKLAAEDPVNLRRIAGRPRLVVMEPTRELCLQVAKELESVAAKHRITVSAVYGGTSVRQQQQDFRRGVDIVVATPGRLLDHIRSGAIDLTSVQHVVLDEGDTMLEMGFQKDVEAILTSVKSDMATAALAASRQLDGFDDEDDRENLRDDVQILLFSATMPNWICQLTEKLMKTPTFLDAVQEGETRLADTISHKIIDVVSGRSFVNAVGPMLEGLVTTHANGGQAIIFANRKEDVQNLASTYFPSLKAAPLHGDISQALRQSTIQQFKDGKINVLVATDVAARGLDIKGVDLVIHASPPLDPDSFVHRSGRTGRAGRPGVSITLVSDGLERKRMEQFKRFLNFDAEVIRPPAIQDLAKSSVQTIINRLSNIEREDVTPFIDHARQLMDKLASGELVLPKIENAESDSDVELIASLLSAGINFKTPAVSLLTGEANMVTLRMDADPSLRIGAATGTWSRLLKSAIEEDLGIPDVVLGRMRVLGYRPVYTLVDMPKEVASEILQRQEEMKDFTAVRITELPAEALQDEHFGGASRGFGDRGGDRRNDRGGDRRNDRGGDRRNDRGGDRRSGGSWKRL